MRQLGSIQHLLRRREENRSTGQPMINLCTGRVEWLKAFSDRIHQKVTGCGHSSTLCLDKHIYKLEYVLLKLILD